MLHISLACLQVSGASVRSSRESITDDTPSTSGPTAALKGLSKSSSKAHKPSQLGSYPSGGIEDHLPLSHSMADCSEDNSTCTSKGKESRTGGVFGHHRQREEDYFEVCHTDVVKCIVITDGGKIFTGG